jgi:hypothetical protein
VGERLRHGAVFVAALCIIAAVSFGAVGSSGPLRLAALIVVLTLAVGLGFRSPTIIAVSFALATVELAVCVSSALVSISWIPNLAAAVYLSAELATTSLEVRGAVPAPREPLRWRVVAIAATTAGVWSIAGVVLIAGRIEPPGREGVIIGVAAGAVLLTSIGRVLRRRVVE